MIKQQVNIKKMNRGEMLKGISMELAGVVFAVPGVLLAEEKDAIANKKSADLASPVIVRLFYDVFSKSETKTVGESLHVRGRLTKSNLKEWDWVIPAPEKDKKILPSSLNITKEVIGDNLGDESTYVGTPVFQDDGSVKIHPLIEVRRRKGATLLVTVKYEIVTDGEFNLKTDSAEFEDDKVTLELPDDEKDRSVRSSFVQAIYSNGKKENINISNADDDYIVQNGLRIKLCRDKKTIYVKNISKS